jgi:hypothetical protein
LYVWESLEALAAFRESELRATIAKAYQVQGEPDIEVYRIFKVLRDGNLGNHSRNCSGRI